MPTRDAPQSVGKIHVHEPSNGHAVGALQTKEEEKEAAEDAASADGQQHELSLL